MLTYDNALFFENLCKMTVRTRDKVFILKELVEDFEYGELLELENIGLINADKGIGFILVTCGIATLKLGVQRLKSLNLVKMAHSSMRSLYYCRHRTLQFDSPTGQ